MGYVYVYYSQIDLFGFCLPHPEGWKLYHNTASRLIHEEREAMEGLNMLTITFTYYTLDIALILI
jgi:hypothetical protein